MKQRTMFLNATGALLAGAAAVALIGRSYLAPVPIPMQASVESPSAAQHSTRMEQFRSRPIADEIAAGEPLPTAPAVSAQRILGKAAERFAPPDQLAPPRPGTENERYLDFADNPLKLASEEPVATFSIDVDTASYAVIRRYLNDGLLPPRDAVRTEELINYFDYDYPLPASRDEPFRADVALFDSPWDGGTQLLRIGLRGYDIPIAKRPAANLVFLVDTSGS